MTYAHSFSAHVITLALLFLPLVVFGQGLQNPVSAYPSIAAFIEGVLRAIVYIALPIIAFFIVLAGFQYVTARGDIGKIGDAHKNFRAVIIGAALILGSWVLATLIATTVSQLVGR